MEVKPDLQQNKCCNEIKQNIYVIAAFILLQFWFHVQ